MRGEGERNEKMDKERETGERREREMRKGERERGGGEVGERGEESEGRKLVSVITWGRLIPY